MWIQLNMLGVLHHHYKKGFQNIDFDISASHGWKINKTPLGWFVLSSVCTTGRRFERVLHSVFSVTMTAFFWTELRGSCWNHSPRPGVTAPNAPNYHRDRFWLSPPTSAPFISSTPGISFPSLLPFPDVTLCVDDHIYRVPSSAPCQPQLCLHRLPRVTCLSGT